MFHGIWNYAHYHWQDNVIASAIWAIPAYLWGRYHFKKIHFHNAKMHEKLDRMMKNGE